MQKKPCNNVNCNGKAYYFDECMSEKKIGRCMHPEYFAEQQKKQDTQHRIYRINELLNSLTEMQQSMLVMKQYLHQLLQEECNNA